MAIRAPRYLEKGDKIGLVATARKVSPEEMKPFIDYMSKQGFEVVEAPGLYEEQDQFAGDDECRAAQLQWAIDHSNLKAIMCARGGYGTIRMIDKVDLSGLSSNPKWIIGFSDVTILLNHLLQSEGIQSLHGPMAIQFTEQYFDEATAQRLVDKLVGRYESIVVEGNDNNRIGSGKGELAGGNLSMIYSAMGTPYEVNMEGKILLLEDLDEYLYHVDRMLMNLKTAGKLSGLKGLIVGGMNAMNDNTIPFGRRVAEMLHEHTEEFDYPICFDFPSGHDVHNFPIKIGGTYQLEVSEKRVVLSEA